MENISTLAKADLNIYKKASNFQFLRALMLSGLTEDILTHITPPLLRVCRKKAGFLPAPTTNSCTLALNCL